MKFDEWLITDEAEKAVNNFGIIPAMRTAWEAARRQPIVRASQVLSRDERDALVAANILLASLQSNADPTFHDRIQMVINQISDMLYEGQDDNPYTKLQPPPACKHGFNGTCPICGAMNTPPWNK